MDIKTKTLLLLMVALVAIMLSAGCSMKQPAVTTEVTDSVHVREVPRIVEVTIPGDTVTIEVEIECDPETLKPVPIKQERKSTKASAQVQIDTGGILTSMFTCDEYIAEIETKDKEISRLRSTTSTRIITEQYTAWYDKAARVISIITIVYLTYKIGSHVK